MRLGGFGDFQADVFLAPRVEASTWREALAGFGVRHAQAHRNGWIMRGTEVEGRLVWRDERPGYDVVVDERRLSWEEFGAALEPFEGWTFRLSMQDIATAE